MKLNSVYLNFAGNSEEVFLFYKSVLGGKFDSLVRFKDMPMDGVILSAADGQKIMNIALPVGKSGSIMASDALESLGQKVVQGNNFYINLSPDTKAEADKIFKALSKGGVIEMAMFDAPWGDYFGSFKDKFGIGWMLNTPIRQPVLKAKAPDTEFPKIGAPASRALANAGITSLKQLAQKNEASILRLHGMGPKAMRLLKLAMKAKKLSFKK